jgi:6-pyruvoyl-tetrahydropterin synthase
MEQLTTLYIDKESHKFSAAHFTIFSATERERLHGHNYSVSARIVAPMGDNGFSADYNVYKTRLARLCDELDEYMLLAGDSPYQTIEEAGACYRVTFAGEEMLFLQGDTLSPATSCSAWSTSPQETTCGKSNCAWPPVPARRAVPPGAGNDQRSPFGILVLCDLA